VTVLLLPPSFDVLLKRLRSRGSENDERLRRRLETARGELETSDFFDYVVINEHVRDTVGRVRAIMTAERQRRNRQDPQVRELCRRLHEGLEKALE
jgi:guanylate kinase